MAAISLCDDSGRADNGREAASNDGSADACRTIGNPRCRASTAPHLLRHPAEWMAVPRARRSRLICAVSDSRSASRVADGRDGGGGTGMTPNRSAVSLLRATRSCWLQSICDQSGPCEEEADVGCAVATLRTASSSQMRRYSPAVAKTRMKAPRRGPPRSVVEVCTRKNFWG